MKRGLVLASTLAVAAFTGCAGDVREGLISQTIEIVKQATTNVTTIKDRLSEAVKKAEKDQEKPLDLKEAFLACESLKDAGKQLQVVKRKAEMIKEPITKEERAENKKKYKDRLSMALDDLNKERKALVQLLESTEQEERYQKMAQELRQKLIEAEGEFEALARQS